MQIRGNDYVVDWQHLIFVLLVAAAVGWYLLDARAVSTATNNLLLVQPLSLFALALCAIILPQCLRRADQAAEEDQLIEDDPLAPPLPKEGRDLAIVALLGVALGAFVFTLEIVGFDVGIWAFSLVAMMICGERRPLALLVYPLAVALASVYGFRALMPYPMFTTIL
jgi:type IV secretory pathway TrbD component